MKSIVIERPGQGVEAWKLERREAPTPGPGQVLVRMRAASVNYRDLMIAKGFYGGPPKRGLVVLSDGAGEVAGWGPDVEGRSLGERVACSYYPAWQAGPYYPELEGSALGIGQNDGVLAEYALVPARGIVGIPDSLSFEEAATLPCAGVTAWQALFEGGSRLLPGSTVLVQGTGGVSLFAAQLAQAAGHRVIATSSSDAKRERLRELGIEESINYRAHPEWSGEVLRLTGGEGADLVVDVGGGVTLGQALAAVKNGGRIAVVGLLGGMGQSIDPLPVLFRTVTLEGIHVGSVSMFEHLLRGVSRLSIKPVIDRTFDIDEAHRALSHVASGEHFGKVVVRIS